MSDDDNHSATCPPHHWDIGRAGSIETWTCTRCQVQRVLDRKKLDSARPPFTMGGPRKPAVTPPDTEAPPT